MVCTKTQLSHRLQKSWDDGRKPTIPITDDEHAISYESAGTHEVSSEEPSQHKEEGQNTQQQLGLLLAEISVLQQEHAADRELIEMLKAHSVERAQEMKQQSMRVAAFMQAAQSEYQDREKSESVNAQKHAQSEQLGHSDMHTGMPAAAGMKSKSTVMTLSSFKIGKNNRRTQRVNTVVSAKSNANARGSAAAGTCNHEIAGSYYRCLTGMTRKVAAEQRGDHGAAEQRGDHGDTKKNDATESRRTEYSAAPHDHNVMNWGVMLMGGHGSDPVPSWKQAFPYTPLARKHAKSASEQELRKMIRARFDKALGTSRQLLTLVSTLTTDTWSSDKFRRTVDTSWVCIAAWMIR